MSQTPKKEILTFEQFCELILKIYTRGIPEENQCSGYHILKNLVKNNEEPYYHKLELDQPTNLQGIHIQLRSYIIYNWDHIKSLKFENE